MTVGSINQSWGTNPPAQGADFYQRVRNWNGADTFTGNRSLSNRVYGPPGASSQLGRDDSFLERLARGEFKSPWSSAASNARFASDPVDPPLGVDATTNPQPRPKPDAKRSIETDWAHLIGDALRQREIDAEYTKPDEAGSPARRPSKGSRPPRRARYTDNAYVMTDRYLYDLSMKGFGMSCPVNPLNGYTWFGGAMQSFGVTSWLYSTLLTANDQIRIVEKLRSKIVGSSFDAGVFLAESKESLQTVADTARRMERYLHYLSRKEYGEAWRALFGSAQRKGDGWWTSSSRASQLLRRGLKGELGRKLDPRSPTYDPVYAKKWQDLKTFHREMQRFQQGGEPPSILKGKSIAEVHLQLQYGWLPLLSDVSDAIDAVSHQIDSPGVKTYRSGRFVEQVNSRYTSWTYCPGLAQVYAYGTKSHRRGVIVKFKERVHPSVVFQGVLNPWTVAWEKFSYSFVADWLIPISQYLSARGFASGLDITVVTTDKLLGRALAPEPAEKWVYTAASTYPVGYNSVYFERKISTTLDVPLPEFKPLNKALTWRHAANAVALIVQRFAGGQVGSRGQPLG